MGELLGLPREALDRARRSRDARFDGKFVIAVLSTGIYCRPICPVRLSSAVRYYATAAEAAAAGFRPCLRCRPEAAPGSPAWTGTSAVVRRALRLIEEGALDTGSVEGLAERLGVGARHLNRLLVDQVGASPIAIAQTRRLHFAKQLLNETDLPITEIALAAGYGSVRRFNSAFKATYKTPPRELRRRRRAEGAGLSEITLLLSYRPPYDWTHMFGFLARHAVPEVEQVSGVTYARALATAGGQAILTMTARPDANAVEMRVRGALPGELFELASAARRAFDLAADPAQIAACFAGEPLLAPLVAARPGLRIPGAWDPFECAVRAILEHHIRTPAGRAAAWRQIAAAGAAVQATGGPTRLFPTPVALARAGLTAADFPPACITALRDLAEAVCAGTVRWCDPVEQAVHALSRIVSMPPCAPQLVAMRAYAEPDAFPAADLRLRRSASHNGNALSSPVLEARAESWRPWRAYAAIYLWASHTA